MLSIGQKKTEAIPPWLKSAGLSDPFPVRFPYCSMLSLALQVTWEERVSLKALRQDSAFPFV
jgi:hypothetical protein